MSERKLFTVSMDKDALGSVVDAIKFGNDLPGEIESVKGPYFDQDDSEALFVVSVKKEREGMVDATREALLADIRFAIEIIPNHTGDEALLALVEDFKRRWAL